MRKDTLPGGCSAAERPVPGEPALLVDGVFRFPGSDHGARPGRGTERTTTTMTLIVYIRGGISGGSSWMPVGDGHDEHRKAAAVDDLLRDVVAGGRLVACPSDGDQVWRD